jgi:hypothetical protein
VDHDVQSALKALKSLLPVYFQKHLSEETMIRMAVELGWLDSGANQEPKVTPVGNRFAKMAEEGFI